MRANLLGRVHDCFAAEFRIDKLGDLNLPTKARCFSTRWEIFPSRSGPNLLRACRNVEFERLDCQPTLEVDVRIVDKYRDRLRHFLTPFTARTYLPPLSQRLRDVPVTFVWSFDCLEVGCDRCGRGCKTRELDRVFARHFRKCRLRFRVL